MSKYIRSLRLANEKFTLGVLSDASDNKDCSQLCYIIGFVTGTVSFPSAFHLLSLSSHRSCLSANYTPTAEILAASEAVDEVVMLKKVFRDIFRSEVSSYVIVGSKDLYHSLSSKRNTVDKSVRPDVNDMRSIL